MLRSKLTGLLLFGLAFGCAAQNEVPYAFPEEHDATVFYNEYSRDPTAADAKYKEKKVKLHRPVWEGSDKKKVVIRVWVLNPGDAHWGIRCCFDGPAKWPARGEYESVVGVCMGMQNEVVVLQKCEIIGVGGWVE